MRLLTILLLSVPSCCATAQDPGSDFRRQPPVYNMPYKMKCAGEWHTVNGLIVCKEKALAYPKIKYKLPPVPGKLRVVDCERELTADGNPDDFNTVEWMQGWWIFARRIIRLTETPEVTLGFRNSNLTNCPVVSSISGVGTGTQTGVMVFDIKSNRSKELLYRCGRQGDPHMFGDTTSLVVGDGENSGIGACQVLSGNKIRVTWDRNLHPAVLNVAAISCGIADQKNYLKEDLPGHDITVQHGICVYDMSLVTSSGTKKVRLVTLGDSGGRSELDNPVVVRQDGRKFRVVKPLGADIYNTEIYRGNRVIWRSEKRDSKSFHIDREDDVKWEEGDLICTTAYRDADGSMGKSCYRVEKIGNRINVTQVGYDFL